MQEKEENNTKTIHRLQEYITKKGISFNRLAIELGLSNSYFSKMVKSGGSIGSDVIEKILRIHTDIDANWLLTGNSTSAVVHASIETAEAVVNEPMFCKLYKEEKAENKALSEEIGALKLTVRQLEEKVLGLQAWKDANNAPFLQPKEIITEKPASSLPKPLPKKDSPAGYAPAHSME